MWLPIFELWLFALGPPILQVHQTLGDGYDTVFRYITHAYAWCIFISCEVYMALAELVGWTKLGDWDIPRYTLWYVRMRRILGSWCAAVKKICLKMAQTQVWAEEQNDSVAMGCRTRMGLGFAGRMDIRRRKT